MMDKVMEIDKATDHALDQQSVSQLRIQRAALKLFAEKGSTQLTVSNLAAAAGVARGTIYNNDLNLDSLFEDIATQLSNEMSNRVLKTLAATSDPLERIAIGIKLYVRRAHDEPDWARFVCRFALNSTALSKMWVGEASPARDVMVAIDQKVLDIQFGQIASVVGYIGGGVVGAMVSVLEGYKTWRDAGTDISEFILRGLGVSKDQAVILSKCETLPLAVLD